MPESGSRVKSSKSKGQFCRFLAAAVYLRKMALLGLGSVVSYPLGQLVGGKADGSLHQENNYIKKKMGEAHSFSFSHNPSIPVGSINLALGSFCRPARQRSSPLLAHGQNDLQRRAFDPSPLIITQEI